MATTRRQFIKRGAGAVTLSLFMPQLMLRGANAQDAPGPRKLVKIFLFGGNDGLNTLVPYTDPRYYELRPVIGLKESDLKDAQGRSTIISDKFGLHPALTSLKALYDEGKVAIVAGAGSAKPNLSHFDMTDQLHSGDPTNHRRDGWLGRYLNLKFGQGGSGRPGIPGMALKSLFAPRTFQPAIDTPSIPSFADYGLQPDPSYPTEQRDVLKVLEAACARATENQDPSGEFSRVATSTFASVQKIKSIPESYRSSVVYPVSSIADALKMVAQVMVAVPEVGLFYVEMGGFDTHSRQITDADNRVTGTHATLLGQFATGVAAFHNDLKEHSLADQVLMMTVSDFGRQVPQNASNGTDHGSAAPMFVMGNPVRGGLYGEQPSLAASKLDAAGNMAVTVDFRAVYSNILEKWLDADPELVLDKRFEDLGFLG